MYQSFESLPMEKKQKIIDACMQEFAEKGYENASTNVMVKNAGISKGILFHYFGNKKNLYLYILDYTIDYYIEKFFQGYTNPSPDIFERLIERSKRKMQLAYESPFMYKLTFEAFVNTPGELKTDIRKRYEMLLAEQLPLAFKGIDHSKFRKGINSAKAIELIVLALEGLVNKYLKAYKDKSGWSAEEMEKVMEEYVEYIEILKYGVYG